MRKTILFAALAALGVCVCSCGGNKTKNQEPAPAPAQNPVETIEEDFEIEEEEPVVDDNKIYCRAFDGFFNMRQEATLSSPRVGKFYNGPEGAEILEISDDGDWYKVDTGEKIGWVHYAYLQYTPTEAYTGEVQPEWVQGAWVDDERDILFLYDSGTWTLTWDDEAKAYGLYRLQNNEVKFETAWYDYKDFDCVLAINKAEKKLGDFEKVSGFSDLQRKVRVKFYPVAAQIRDGSSQNLLEVSESNDLDALIDEYERYMDKSIALHKKVMHEDASAMGEYMEVQEKALDLAKRLDNCKDEMTQAQAERIARIAAKGAQALM